MNATEKPPLIHYPLKAEVLIDDDGPMVRLEQQEGIDDTQVIVVHPWQLRATCAQLGIVQTDAEAERELARLYRRLKTLAGRIDHLNHWLHNLSDAKHADLTYEQTYSQATAELADEFLADIDEAEESRPTEPKQGELL